MAFGLLPASALAQVVITGSSIKQISSETALPVTVLKADDLAKAGVTSAEQALAFITSNQSATNSAFSVSTSNGGASFADLRGLGQSRTLVLLNGKRMVNNPYDSGSASAVDLNTIPYGAVDRIEVLNDGASALYGSDAIAGVINFITRKEFQGLNVTGSASLPTSSGGGQQYDLGFTGGVGSLTEQGWNIFGGLSWRKQEALGATDRSFANTAYIPSRGVDKTSTRTFPATYSQAPLETTFNPSLPGCNPPSSLPIDGACGFNYVPFVKIIPEQEQVSAIVKGSYAVDKDNTVSLEYIQGNNKLTSVISPTPLVGLTMPSTNPFYPGGPGLGGVPGTAANTDPAFDPNADISLDWRTTTLGGRASVFDNKTDRFLLDWQGAYKNWYYSVAALQSNSNVKNTFTGGYVNEGGVMAGLTGVPATAGGSVPPWLNPFGSQTAEGAAYLTSQKILGQVQQAEGRLSGLKAEASGEIYAMPAGPLTMGVGLEYYRDKATYTNNFDLIRQAASSGLELTEDSSGSRSWWGLFVEFNLPITKEVDLNLAARYDDYSDFGGTFNPKAAIRWAPTKQMLFRGSINSGFRAPTLYEAYAPRSLTFTENNYDDPVLCPGGVVNTAAGGVQSRDCGVQFQAQAGGNPNLQPETSTAWSVGMVLQPITSTTFSADYWNYTVKNTINTIGEQVIFGDTTKYANNFVRCSQLSASDRDAIDACRIPGGDPLAYIVNTQTNLGNYKTSGIDFTAGWHSDGTEYGRFSLGWQATWVLQYEYQLEAGGPYFNNLGTYFNGQPISRYRQFLNLGWQMDAWTVNLINHYSAGYNDENLVDPQYFNKVGATNTWDLAVTWSGYQGMVLTAGLTNMFNQEPPFSNQGSQFQVGYDPRYSNPIGRAFLLRANFTF